MTPKISFRYSWIYDNNFERWSRPYRTWKYPSDIKTRQYIKKAEPQWRKYEKKILNEMAKVTGLSWNTKEIPAYVVGSCIPFSDPLTLRPRKNIDDFIDTLTHECIHQLFTQEKNLKIWKKSWSYVYRKYNRESRTTQIHIPLHAIHEHIFRTVFNEKRLNREIDDNTLKDYKRSWEIVQKEGYQNIIAAMKTRAANH